MTATAQIQYLAARAAIDTMHADDAAWLDTAKAFRAAEAGLFAWARCRIESDPKTRRTFAAVAGDVDFVFNAAKSRPNIADRVADLCLRLAPVAA